MPIKSWGSAQLSVPLLGLGYAHNFKYNLRACSYQTEFSIPPPDSNLPNCNEYDVDINSHSANLITPAGPGLELELTQSLQRQCQDRTLNLMDLMKIHRYKPGQRLKAKTG